MRQLSTQPRGEVMLNLTDRHTGPHKGLMIMSSRPPSLRSPVGTSREVNEPLRSLGRSNPTSSVFGVNPLRHSTVTGAFPNPARPGRVSHSPGARSTQTCIPRTLYRLDQLGKQPTLPGQGDPPLTGRSQQLVQQPIINQLPPQLTRLAERLIAPWCPGHSQSPSDHPNSFYTSHLTPSMVVSLATTTTSTGAQSPSRTRWAE